MIAQTTILEDTIVLARYYGDVIVVTVSDSLTGFERTINTTWLSYTAAIALAMGGDEIPGASELYPEAEKLMTTLAEGLAEKERHILRFIP